MVIRTSSDVLFSLIMQRCILIGKLVERKVHTESRFCKIWALNVIFQYNTGSCAWLAHGTLVRSLSQEEDQVCQELVATVLSSSSFEALNVVCDFLEQQNKYIAGLVLRFSINIKRRKFIILIFFNVDEGEGSWSLASIAACSEFY